MSKAIDEMSKEIVFETLSSLVSKNLLSVKDAAEHAQMSEEEFTRHLKYEEHSIAANKMLARTFREQGQSLEFIADFADESVDVVKIWLSEDAQ